MKKNLQTALFSCTFLLLAHISFAQADSTKKIMHLSGSVSVTNKGISVIPTFTLGKPAAIFTGSIGKSRFSFDPELRFSLAGKPWGFIFWGRYKVINTNKLQVNAGTHLGIAYKSTLLSTDGENKEEVTIAKRYLAGELAPKYTLSKNISMGAYYLYSHGIDAGTTKNTHFVTFNSTLSNIRITNQFFFSVTPQVYYLKMDAADGYYFTSGFTLSKKNFPVTASAFFNKAIRTNIPGSADFLWNATLTYSFHKRYIKL